MTNTEERTHIPKGVNLKYLEKVLRNYYEDQSLTVTDFEIKPAKGFAFHYGGFTNKIRVTLKRFGAVMNTSLILKEPFQDSEDGILQLENEMALYKDVIPAINSKIHGINKDFKVVPNKIAINDTNDFVILEDLSLLRYNFFHFNWKIDINKMRLVLTKLAYLHASSAVHENRNPGSFLKFKKNHHIHLDNLYKKVYKSLEKNLPSFTKLNLKEPELNENHFNCLVHGSVWEPNILFKLQNNSEDELKDVIFINYHYAYYGSPTIDLQKYIHSIMLENCNEAEKDLVEFYYYKLKNLLQRMVYKDKIPKFEEFWMQYNHNRVFGEIEFIC